MDPPEDLFDAAEAGDLAKIRWFLDQGVTVDDTWDDRNPLHLAAKGGHDQAVKLLLDRGEDCNKVDDDGESALHYAAISGRVEAVKCLLDHGADVSKVNKDGLSALHYAARNGRVETVKCLLDHGADVSTANKCGWIALHYAAENGNVEAVKCLLDHGADVSKVGTDGLSALHLAASSGKVEAVKCLLDHGADVSEGGTSGWTALHSAAGSGNVEAVKCLLDHGADVSEVDTSGWTALRSAAGSGNVEAVKLLLDHGADVNKVDGIGCSALRCAAGSGKVEAMKCLLDHGADVSKVNNHGGSALHSAARFGQAEAMKCLLDHGADVNKVNTSGCSALHYAAIRGQAEAVKCLLDRGADVNKVDTSGWSALHYAADNGRVEALKCLLDHGADVSKVDTSGRSALHHAADNAEVEAVKYLLDHGADFNEVNQNGESAFDLATRIQLVEAANYMLNFDDCVLEQPRKKEYDPVYLAISAGNADLLRYLLAFGADVRMRKSLINDREILGILRKDSGYKDEAELRSGFRGVGKVDKMIQAVQNNKLDLLKSISEQDEKILKENGEALLLESCKWGFTRIVDFLLGELDPPVNQPGAKRSTSLHEAARRGHRRIVKLLLERGTPIDIRNISGETPLHEAARWGKWPVAAFLIKRGARIHVMNTKRETPLHLATQNGWKKVVEILTNPSIALSDGKKEPESLEEVYEAITKRKVILDEDLIKRTFTRKNIRGIRDLVAGHQVLEIGHRCGIIPTERLDQLYFMQHFYHGIIGKLHTEQEINVTEKIFRSAESQGILARGEVAATLGDVETLAHISETIAPVIFDLTLRVQDVEERFAEARSAILQIQRAIQNADRQSIYLAFLRLGQSFIPIAGGALGTSIDVIRNALEVMDKAGTEIGNLCGLSSSMMDVIHPLLENGSVRSDLEELKSLKERLSAEFLEALPEQPRNIFITLVNTNLTGGIEKLRQELDNLLQEIDNNKDYLKSKETEVVEVEEITEDKRPPTRQRRLDIRFNTQVVESKGREDDTERGEGNECLTTGAQGSSKKSGEIQNEASLLFTQTDETERVIEPLIRDLRLWASQIQRTHKNASRVGDANVSSVAQLLEDLKVRIDEALYLLPK